MRNGCFYLVSIFSTFDRIERVVPRYNFFVCDKKLLNNDRVGSKGHYRDIKNSTSISDIFDYLIFVGVSGMPIVWGLTGDQIIFLLLTNLEQTLCFFQIDESMSCTKSVTRYSHYLLTQDEHSRLLG